jgi:hypothetical protein
MKELTAFRKFLAEGIVKEELIDRIKNIGDYNNTEDTLDYKDYFVQKDEQDGKSMYSVWKSSEDVGPDEQPDFESTNPNAVKDFLLKEDKLI